MSCRRRCNFTLTKAGKRIARCAAVYIRFESIHSLRKKCSCRSNTSEIASVTECSLGTLSCGNRVSLGIFNELLIVGLALGTADVAAADDKQMDCHVGTYRFLDRPDVDIGREDNRKLRWRRTDGTSGELTRAKDGSWSSTLGWTGKPDRIHVRFPPCGKDGIRFDGIEGKRIAFEVTETRFAAEDAELVGRLVMPMGSTSVPIVVLIHGSEHDSARDYYSLQREFPSAGIGAFVYDKRGTGASSGQYTQDYLTLANDAIAAMREARRLAGRFCTSWLRPGSLASAGGPLCNCP